MESQRIKVYSGGKIHLPNHIREKMHLKDGDELIATYDHGTLKLTSYVDMVRSYRKMISEQIPKEISLVDELIKTRREENKKLDEKYLSEKGNAKKS